MGAIDAVDNSYSTPTLTDCIISGNNATSGGGISEDGNGATLINTILSGNQAVRVWRSDIQLCQFSPR